MSLFGSTFCRTCGQVLCLLLVLAVSVQGLPVHTVVQHFQNAHSHHECSHAKGYCPTNPDGPCRCDHDAPDSPQEPTIQSCGNTTSLAVLTATSPKWRPSAEKIPAPRSRPLVHVSTSAPLFSQRMGDDVFHPPRVQAAARPGSTLQVSHFA